MDSGEVTAVENGQWPYGGDHGKEGHFKSSGEDMHLGVRSKLVSPAGPPPCAFLA